MRARAEVELSAMGKPKKFVRYEEGAKLYSMGLCTFKGIAKNAHAIYTVGRIVLVNTEKLDAYLESFAEG